jgi:hypothetical protein
MPRIQDVFKGEGRKLTSDERVLVDAFNAKYEALGVKSMPKPPSWLSRPRPQPARAGRRLPPLLPLKAFHDAHPQLTWRPVSPTSVLSIRTGARLVLQFQDTCVPLGHHLWRDEELMEKGVLAHEADSKDFAEALTRALAPQLSPWNLEHLIAALSAEKARQDAGRDAAINTQSISPAASVGSPAPEA